MNGRSAETNLQTYDSPETAAHYAALEYLTPCERLLFDTYIEPGSSILDLGVGGGRTTPYLANRASRYVGVDYAGAMVRACQAKFPDLEFVVADASDLSAFASSSFDAIVFSFNGIDYVQPEQSRRKCFEHVRRILKPGGVVIFSSHNARAVLVRAGWNRSRLQRMAKRFAFDSKLLYGSWMVLFTLLRSVFAFGQTVGKTVQRSFQRIPKRMFWNGEGNLIDSAHGGLLTHYWVPSRVVRELDALHLRPERILGDDYPKLSHPYSTDWYYYVFTKPCDK
jgi:SAM-dependent methyltransferase